MSRRPPSRSLVEQFPRQHDVTRARFGALAAARRGGTLTLSLLAHAAVAAAVVHGGGSSTRVATGHERERLLEMTAPELADVPAPDAPHPSVAVPHTTTAPTESVVSHVAPSVSHASSRIAAAETSRTAEAPAVVSAPATAAHFVMTAPVSVPLSAGAAAGAAGVVTVGVAPAVTTPLSEREVDVAPRLLAGAPPAYPASAETAGVESSVPVELVIDPRGAVTSAAALGHVGYGLDEAALAAVRGYRFAPARRNGAAVAVRMRWVVRFELR